MTIKNIVPLSAVLAVAIAMMAYGWIGYYGSDDMSYAAGGVGWMADFPFVGYNHWTLRHTVVGPMAVAFLLGGVQEFTLVVGTCLYFLALVGAVFVIVTRHFDRYTGAIAAFHVATLPLMATQSTVVVPDFAEVFFCLMSLAFFFEATLTTLSERKLLLLAAAGLAAGLSWLTRETVVFILLTYGILFLFGFGIERKLCFVMAAAFAAIVGVEFAYFWILEGNPFYRLAVDFSTHLKTDPSNVEKLAERFAKTATGIEGPMYGELSRTGNLSVNRLADPILAVLLNQEFMFFYYIAAPAAVWTAITYNGDRTRKTFLRVFGCAGLVWFVCLWLQIGMSLLPRYYMLPTVIIAILFAVWIRTVAWPRQPVLTVLLVGFLFVANLLGIYVDNRNPLFAERALVEFALQQDEVVHTDPETLHKGRFLFDASDVSDRIKAAPPQPNVLFFSNPKYVVEGLNLRGGRGNRDTELEKLAPYRPKDSWTVVWRKSDGRKLVGVALDVLGLKDLVPSDVYRRLNKPNADVAVYRP